MRVFSCILPEKWGLIRLQTTCRIWSAVWGALSGMGDTGNVSSANGGCRGCSGQGCHVRALYLLTADQMLWGMASQAVQPELIDFSAICIRGISLDGYVLFHSAKDLYKETNRLSLSELADPEQYTFTLPKRQTAAGIYNIFNHICEQYFSGEDDNTSDYISEVLMKSISFLKIFEFCFFLLSMYLDLDGELLLEFPEVVQVQRFFLLVFSPILGLFQILVHLPVLHSGAPAGASCIQRPILFRFFWQYQLLQAFG